MLAPSKEQELTGSACLPLAPLQPICSLAQCTVVAEPLEHSISWAGHMVVRPCPALQEGAVSGRRRSAWEVRSLLAPGKVPSANH